MSFTTDYQEVIGLVDRFDPKNYARSRNHIRGEVSRLSPYISRGVISTKMIRDNLFQRSYDLSKIEKFMQELAWRDYWQQTWIAKGDAIDKDFKRKQILVDHRQVPAAIIDARTGIESIDSAIEEMYETGYMHNHVRMYLASIACNFGHSHWYAPALWHYYYLLDADWASNALSWQWVAGSNAGKKYIADQRNVNRYTDSDQKGTFLSDAYDRFPDMPVPDVLSEVLLPQLRTPLPAREIIDLDDELPTYLYNWYNLDPEWEKDVAANRVLLLEPTVFEKYPISQKSMDFMIDLSENIKGIRIAICEFEDLAKSRPEMAFHFKEHPLNAHYIGKEHPRDWMSCVTGYYPSFFAFWKKAKKAILNPSHVREILFPK